ncbi:hypothetical protein CAPTEDRAFT_217664 [Capitella teleta]|uniref:Uncharacterized protein n=1 Tax=Capitella teleta TaxID=283909 RepID=X2AMI4_CAPTE|nr:hypothetical protein CAPTEDRAFT_217664 [Capitella teleta]|eukprot:ELU00281.1 hypothetical protein CAPTEDRAFT_217664 [Capitella teleta]
MTSKKPKLWTNVMKKLGRKPPPPDRAPRGIAVSPTPPVTPSPLNRQIPGALPSSFTEEAADDSPGKLTRSRSLSPSLFLRRSGEQQQRQKGKLWGRFRFRSLSPHSKDQKHPVKKSKSASSGLCCISARNPESPDLHHQEALDELRPLPNPNSPLKRSASWRGRIATPPEDRPPVPPEKQAKGYFSLAFLTISVADVLALHRMLAIDCNGQWVYIN